MTRVRRLGAALLGGGTGTVFLLLVLIFAGILAMNPAFFEGPSLMAFLKQAAPLVILAAGQYFVIVSGNFDLSVGALVGAQVVIAARLIDGEESRTLPVLLVMLAFGLAVGLVNGLITTVLKVQSFITTLGMLLVLYGAIRLWTGGAPTGSLSEAFRTPGRLGIENVPLIGQIPWALLIMLAVGAGAILLMRTRFGRVLLASGDNELAAKLSGARVDAVRTSAFVLSGLSATIAGILIGGFAGVSAQVGEGLEFTVITAVVLGGVVLGGGRGTALAAMAGALAIEALFTLFNQMALPATLRPTVQGVIIIAAVAYAARQRSRPGAAAPKSTATATPS
ncbi:ABC transporter permease [Glycomyces rhizosphaerae]|uniref:Autoinducer 2 import system permease protein LsrD n=1 Tax=Glycomyces rhizosphaerae TaxID=2054422 RepID=A0ABV7Q806_9ACTN